MLNISFSNVHQPQILKMYKKTHFQQTFGFQINKAQKNTSRKNILKSKKNGE